MPEITSEIKEIIKTPEFQKKMDIVGPVLLLSGEKRGLSARAIKAEIDEFALRAAKIILEEGQFTSANNE